MAEIIQRIFIDPPIAIARLGASTTPLAAFRWVESPNPRSPGETTIEPDWSLVIRSDGITVEPTMPTSLAFRDGGLIRPVSPFFELWALVGEAGSNPSTWNEVPLTPDLLTSHGVALNRLVFRIDAKNFKVFRRTANAGLKFGTFPPLEVRGDNHTATAIFAVSPPGVPASRRMIPANQSIPLGSFQVIKSRPQPPPDPTNEWTQLKDGRPMVNVEVVRFRFTPARGHFYGPPNAAQPHNLPEGKSFAPVEATRAFLNANAGWEGANAGSTAPDAPQDTYDGADVGNDRSLGVVDDTCEARIEASLTLPSNEVLTAATTVFVGPPDFAPDRRPFLSIADELNDRTGENAARTESMSNADRDAWVQDLFERIYETLSLLNLDRWRTAKAITLTGSRLAPAPIPSDKTREPSKAMSGRDALRNRSFPFPAVDQDIKLPLTDYAHMRHRALSDLEYLRGFVSQNPGRLTKLIRRSFEAERGELSDGNNGIGTTTMRMPPFMRNSNAGPLTLAPWQYDLLMDWVQALESQPRAAVPLTAAARRAARPLSDAAARRRDQVIARVARGREGRQPGDR